MEKILRKLIHQLKLSGFPFVTDFQNGVSSEYINKVVAPYNLSFPNTVLELFTWKNGLNNDIIEKKTLGECYIFDLGIFFPLEVSLYYYDYMMEHKIWEKKMFPLFGSGGGDFFIIDLRDNSSTNGMIYFYSPSDPSFDRFVTYCDSLELLLKCVLQCFTENVYGYAAYKDVLDKNIIYFDVYDNDAECMIFKRNNPKSSYWDIIKMY